VDLLVTIDPIRFPICSIGNVLLGKGDPQPCNQTFLQTPPSSARQRWGYYQTLGFLLGGAYFAIEGYIPSNASGIKKVPASHADIDDDASVENALNNMLLTAVTGPRVAAEMSAVTRTTDTITVPLTITVQPMLDVAGMILTSATLNGLSATNLSTIKSIGDVSVGASTQLTFQFPIAAGAPGTTGVLQITGQNQLGQVVKFPSFVPVLIP